MAMLIIMAAQLAIILLTIGGVVEGQDGRPSNPSPTQFVVAIVDEPPFVMSGQESDNTTTKYTGLIPDLMDEVMAIIGGEYTVKLLPNEAQATSAVANGEADMAGPVFTSISDKKRTFSPTKPFMNSGFSILLKKPLEYSPSRILQAMLSRNLLLMPFKAEVWCIIIVAYILVSLLLFLFNRFDPYEARRRAQRDEANADKNNLNCCGSFWFALSTFQWQGYDKSPMSCAAKILLAGWFMFVTFTLALFTASLIVLVQIDRTPPLATVSPIRSLDDLAMQSEVRYAVVNGSKAQDRLQSSIVPTQKKLWDTIQREDKKGIFESTEEGATAVQKSNGKQALITTSVQANHLVSQHNDLMAIRSGMASTGLHLATAKHSEYREKLSQAILELRENGNLQKLTQKWFKKDTEDNQEQIGFKPTMKSNPGQKMSFYAMEIRDFIGVSGFLLIVVVLALLAFIIEIIVFRVKSRCYNVSDGGKCEDPELKMLTPEADEECPVQSKDGMDAEESA